MPRLVLLIILMCVHLLPADGRCTRLTERWMIVNPLAQPVASDTASFTLLGTSGFWGEFATYRIETDDDHAYNVKIGGFAEMFRIGRDWSLAFVSNVELVANDRGNLFFRPRAAFWEEGFVVTRRAGSRYWQLGYMHRCKHDIDNLATRECDGAPCERSLIFGSVQGKLLVPLAWQSRGTSGVLAARGDLFTILQDDRAPAGFADRLPNIERAWGTFGIDFHLRKPLHRDWLGGFLTGFTSIQFFGDESGFFSRFRALDRATWDGGVTAGVALEGAAHLRVGLAYEYLDDTSISPDPTSSHLVSLSFTILGAGSQW